MRQVKADTASVNTVALSWITPLVVEREKLALATLSSEQWTRGRMRSASCNLSTQRQTCKMKLSRVVKWPRPNWIISKWQLPKRRSWVVTWSADLEEGPAPLELVPITSQPVCRRLPALITIRWIRLTWAIRVQVQATNCLRSSSSIRQQLSALNETCCTTTTCFHLHHLTHRARITPRKQGYLLRPLASNLLKLVAYSIDSRAQGLQIWESWRVQQEEVRWNWTQVDRWVGQDQWWIFLWRGVVQRGALIDS